MSVGRSFSIGAVGGAIFLTAALAGTPALANGADFFEELALHGLQDNPDMGSPYFGFVRDIRGRGVFGATLTATVKDSGESKSVTTNILGHYTLYGFDKKIDSANVEISCSKAGFRQVDQVARRSYDDRPLQPIEANCKLSPVTAAAR